MQGLEALEIVLPATVAGIVIALIHGPLGIEVLRRGIIFIDLAIAQIAGLCVVFVKIWMHEPNWVLTQIAAGLAALSAAGLFRWVEKTLPHEQEAIIGSGFILAASAVLLVLANHPQGGEEIQHILSGQMLFISWSDVLAFLPLYGAAIIVWFAAKSIRTGLGFFVIFSLVITASVQLVGVYVVFASLILPALAVNPWLKASAGAAVTCGTIAVILGIGISTLSDLPAGPVLVFSYALMTIIFRQTRGIRTN
ncbi:metal ABC transporter permease [Alphaproteobacteria bacterium]|nr:metal ABC transporter permease [Alphaproteobacteria bacterium]